MAAAADHYRELAELQYDLAEARQQAASTVKELEEAKVLS